MTCSNHKLFQTGVLCGFVDKVYQGDCTFQQLLGKGDLGIGTFDDVHGEFVGFDGKFYRIVEDGVARAVDPLDKTPFAWVIDFEETQRFVLNKIDSFEHFSQEFDKQIESPNFIYAYRFSCKAKTVKCRSEACQPKPYKPLAETLPNLQVSFFYETIESVFVGFRFPDYFATLNVPGHHVHFVAPEEKKGGHVFDFQFEYAEVSVCAVKNVEFALIDSQAFRELKISAEDLERVTHVIEKKR